MPQQFENPQTVKMEDKTVSCASTKKKIEQVAEKAAEKASKTEQRFDENNSNLFSK
jgi:predicted secreted Zn-dependent protease